MRIENTRLVLIGKEADVLDAADLIPADGSAHIYSVNAVCDNCGITLQERQKRWCSGQMP